jgi:nucleotide-binding universal stress UspA family protein
MLFSKNRVLVPIDFSEESFKAQQLTLEFVESASCLYLLYVLPNLNAGEPGIVWDAIDDETRKEYVRKKFFEKFTQPEYEGVNFSVSIGDPASEILDFAKEKAIELIVIPSHGRTGLGRFFLGSVAEKVVRFAHCPVLVLRRDELKK